MIPSIKARNEPKVWIGIDPGQKGAIGAINVEGRFLWVVDMPITALGREGEFDNEELVSIVSEIARYRDARVCLEWPTTRPDESAESSKRFGVGLGLIEGMFTFAGIPPLRVAPNKWKGRLGLTGKDKDPLAARRQSVELAREVLLGVPDDALYGPRGGLLDGRAEALLIAWENLTGTALGLRNQPYETRLARLTFGASRRRRKSGPL